MREILFKAKTISGNWVNGLLANKDDKWYISNKADSPFAYEVRPETLCQFTGLCDKNGKRIWENDILMAHLDDSYPEDATYKTVEWGVAGWVTCEANSIDRQYLDEFDLEHFEVVGNIFDNKELLQEESDEQISISD